MIIHRCTQGSLAKDGTQETQCWDEAVARFHLSEGCVAQPGERDQDLCLHHVMRASPYGTFELTEDFTVDAGFTRFWNGS